jgi:DNA-binding response OmpR family regulator
MTGRVRVALASRDRRFLRATRFLLAREGYDVDSVGTPSRLLELAEKKQIDVAVADGSGSLATTARIAGALAEAEQPVRLVIVADDTTTERLMTLPVLPKWDFERLRGEIEQAYLRASPVDGPHAVF